jgi:hypothetical protein
MLVELAVACRARAQMSALQVHPAFEHRRVYGAVKRRLFDGEVLRT